MLKERTTDVLSTNDSISRSEQLTSLNSLVHNDTSISKSSLLSNDLNVLLYPWENFAISCEGCLLMCALFWILSSVLLYGLLFWSLTGHKRNIVVGQNYLCFFFPFFWVGSNTKLTRAMLVVVIRTPKLFFNFFICCMPAAPLNVKLDSSPWESQSICSVFLSSSIVCCCSVHMMIIWNELLLFYLSEVMMVVLSYLPFFDNSHKCFLCLLFILMSSVCQVECECPPR